MNKKRKKFEAKGVLTLQEYNLSFPTHITIIQFNNGKLRGNFRIKNHSEDISELYGDAKRLKFKFLGETLEGKKLKIENEDTYNIEIITKFGEFGPREFKIFNDDSIDQLYPNLSSEFAITNFEMPSNEMSINLQKFKVKFKKFEDYETQIKSIKEFKETYMTSYAIFDGIEIENSSPVDYFNKTKKIIKGILALSGFSSGSYQSWANGEVFDNNNGENELLYGRYINPKKKNTGFNELIPGSKLQQYVNKTYVNYVDWSEDLDLNLVIDWYLESLASTSIEPKYLKGFVCLETLVGGFSKIDNHIFIIKDGEKFKELSEKISEKASEILQEMDFEENREDIICKIPEKFKMKLLNRYNVRNKLIHLLKYFEIGYKDLLSELKNPDISQIFTVRNNIIHQGVPKNNYTHVLKVYNIMICLIQRILLSLLKPKFDT